MEPDLVAMNNALIDRLKERHRLHDSAVEAAFRAIPRHYFLPDVEIEKVYSDEAIVTKKIEQQPVSSSSQPTMMAIMLEQLDLRPGQRVLEIGAGTGFNAALMAYLVGKSGQVITIDIDQDIVEAARTHLAAVGLDRVTVIQADGGLGYPDAAPYDRIILTVGTWDITPAWIEQLAPDGRLVLPLRIKSGRDLSIAFVREGNHLTSLSIEPCGFMHLRGAFAGPDNVIQFAPGMYLDTDHREVSNSKTIYELLSHPGKAKPTGLTLNEQDQIAQWLAIYEANFCSVWAEGEQADSGIIPFFAGLAGKWRYSIGIVERDGLCLLMHPSRDVPPAELPENPPPFELYVQCYGNADQIANRLIERLQAWDALGRPSLEKGLRVRAYSVDTGYVPAAGEVAVPKRWTQLILDWPGEV